MPSFPLQEPIEKFPLECVFDPVAVRDRNGMFNNLILFTVTEDPKARSSPREMHVFQVVGKEVCTALHINLTLFGIITFCCTSSD